MMLSDVIGYSLNNIRLYGLFGLKFFECEYISTESGEGIYPIIPQNMTVWFIGTIALCCIIAYLLGTLNFAMLISKYKYHDDIRSHGSGNAGSTNMLRTYGKKTGVLTFVCDTLKAVVAIAIAWLAFGEWVGYLASLFCILGHAFPVWYGFKGGKGVAVLAASVLCLNWPVFVVLLIVFAAIVYMSKFVSLGSIMSALLYPVFLSSLYPIYIAIFGGGKSYGYGIIILCSAITALLVVFLHKENIKRLLDHNENKISFGKKKKSDN